MARPEPPIAQRAAPAVRGGGSRIWLQGLLCGAVVTLATPTALLLAGLLAPALVALAVDREAGRPVGRSVLLCSLAACVAPMRALWAAGHDLATAAALAGDLTTFGTAWSAAAAGWLLAELAPVGVRMILEALSVSHAARLRASRDTLAVTWGLPPSPDQ